ncbi:hypothetical protein D3C87_1866350 [compost metagenome]
MLDVIPGLLHPSGDGKLFGRHPQEDEILLRIVGVRRDRGCDDQKGLQKDEVFGSIIFAPDAIDHPNDPC